MLEAECVPDDIDETPHVNVEDCRRIPRRLLQDQGGRVLCVVGGLPIFFARPQPPNCVFDLATQNTVSFENCSAMSRSSKVLRAASWLCRKTGAARTTQVSLRERNERTKASVGWRRYAGLLKQKLQATKCCYAAVYRTTDAVYLVCLSFS